MKKSKLIGGSSSSQDKSRSTPTPAAKYHNYFTSKLMISLTNLEISIEDSEISAATFKRYMLQKTILDNNVDPEVLENLEIISTIQNKASEFYKNNLLSLIVKEISVQLSKTS